MAGQIGNSAIDRHRKRAAEYKRSLGKAAAGSPGDLRDRFRGAYRPGARPAPKPGLAHPREGIRMIRNAIKKLTQRRTK